MQQTTQTWASAFFTSTIPVAQMQLIHINTDSKNIYKCENDVLLIANYILKLNFKCEFLSVIKTIVRTQSHNSCIPQWIGMIQPSFSRA